MTPPNQAHDSERRLAALEQALNLGPSPPEPGALASGNAGRPWLEGLALLLLPLSLLLVAHHLLIIRFSQVSPLYLMAASVLLPLPFGFLVSARALPRLPLWFAAGFGMALLATLGMSGVTALVDDSPWLPQGRRDWIELAQFTCSIGLSFATGIILGWVLWRHATKREDAGRRAGLPYRLTRRLLGERYSPEQAHRATTLLLSVLRLLMACITISGSLVSGLQRFVGS
jgi:hypothetical protein